MKISVITVTYNALDQLLKTAGSVACQDYADFEYIIVDGASTDGTPGILKEGIKGVSKWISEPDGGIYEAMNKGTRMASGDYCIFMNAGDSFVNAHVLSKISSCLDGSDVVIGNEVHLDEAGQINGYSPSKGCFTIENLFKSAIRHQATFISRKILLERPYDESLRLVSDWKFFLELRLSPSVTYREINVDICFFSAGGTTDQNRELGAKERAGVLAAYPGYKHIWGTPFKPSFLQKAYRKLLYYKTKIFYSFARAKY